MFILACSSKDNFVESNTTNNRQVDNVEKSEEYLFVSKPFSLNPTPMKRLELKRESESLKKEESKSLEIKCPLFSTFPNEPGKCEAYVRHPTLLTGSVSYYRNGKIETSGNYPIGTSTLLAVLPDSTTCLYKFEVVDDETPTLICPTDVIVETSPLSPDAIANWSIPIVEDNCPGSLITKSTHNPGDRFPIGVTKVTYTAIDASDNEATCSFNIRVKR